MFLYFVFLVLLVTFFLFFVGLIFSLKTVQSKEKSSPYECGFDEISVGRMNFSIQFFVMAIIFLIFDVEISIIFPFSIIKNWLDMWKMNFFLFFMIFILILGLFYEWFKGGLKWVS